MRERIVVLGSNSFSGCDFVDLLLSEDRFDILGISRSPEKHASFLPYFTQDRTHFKYVQADLNVQLDSIIDLLDEFAPKYIVNFAAQGEASPSWSHPEDWMLTNGVAVARLLDRLKERPYIQKYLHVSTPEVYGSCDGLVKEDTPLNPSTPYAASKAAGDLLVRAYARNYSFPASIVRSTNVYGPFQQMFRIIPKAIVLLKRGEKVELHGGGTAIKSYIHIRDVSRGELAIIERGCAEGEIYNISPDASYQVREVVAVVAKMLGRNFDDVTRVVDDRRGQDARYTIDSGKIRSEIGWTPIIGLEQGIREVVDWVEREWDQVSVEPLTYLHKK